MNVGKDVTTYVESDQALQFNLRNHISYVCVSLT